MMLGVVDANLCACVQCVVGRVRVYGVRVRLAYHWSNHLLLVYWLQYGLPFDCRVSTYDTNVLRYLASSVFRCGVQHTGFSFESSSSATQPNVKPPPNRSKSGCPFPLLRVRDITAGGASWAVTGKPRAIMRQHNAPHCTTV
jgi:hypothetical protein